MTSASLIIPHPVEKPWAGESLGRGIGELLLVSDHSRLSSNDSKTRPCVDYPVMTKFIDAKEWLSVQVHPNDEQAKRLEGAERGKFEAWYIMDATPDAEIICGRSEGELVRKTVQRGDLIIIEPGTVHAIGPGILLWEVQQNCDITYRLHDWGRGRELHTEKVAEVATDNVSEVVQTEPGVIINNRHFQVTLGELKMDDGFTPEMGGYTQAVEYLPGDRISIKTEQTTILTTLDDQPKRLFWDSDGVSDLITLFGPRMSTIVLEPGFTGILSGNGRYSLTVWDS